VQTKSSQIVAVATAAVLAVFATKYAYAVDTIEADDSGVATYTATYRVEHEGRSAGVETVSVSLDGTSGHYIVDSTARMEGPDKLLAPQPIVSRSEFLVAGGHVVPIRSWISSGKRRDDQTITEYNWLDGVATNNRGAAATIETGDLDIATLRTALMVDLSRTADVGSYRLIDDGKIKFYEFINSGDADFQALQGGHRTVLITREAEGGSSGLLMWMAPDLCYLPMKIEQQKHGETQTRFVIESLDGIDPDSCLN